MTRHKEWFGLYAPDEQYVKRPLEELVSQTSLLVVPQAFPHISAHRYEHTWQQQWGLSVSQGHLGIFRVMGNQCRRRTKPLAQCRPPGYAHPSLWLWQGQLICDLTQPYHLGDCRPAGDEGFCRGPRLNTQHLGVWRMALPGQCAPRRMVAYLPACHPLASERADTKLGL